MLFADGAMLLSGPVPRRTAFEKLSSGRLIERGGGLEPDEIIDDQSLFLDLAGKGLLVISGCAHAGIINTVRWGQKLTGQQKVHAVIGGFHLSGTAMAPVVGPTVEELKAISPEVVMPMHCTGMTAIAEIARALPAAFVLASAGSRLVLAGK
jgi:7,8-dihydropterin-6-yl-methyl-4-(beta-D-ribofuranosyl)aminobenzene 5'-phosphate synthase